jgi:hypothetical protein
MVFDAKASLLYNPAHSTLTSDHIDWVNNLGQPFLLPELHKADALLRPIMSTVWATTYSLSILQASLSVCAAPFFPQVAYSSALKIKASGSS